LSATLTFADIPHGAAVFLDANVLLHHFTGHPQFGAASSGLLDRIEKGECEGWTSAPMLGEMIHRLMTIEACTRFGWPPKGIANRLRRHPAEVQQLDRYRQAIDELAVVGIKNLDSTRHLVSLAVDVIRQTGLLSTDALVVVTMRDKGLTNLASNDADFDRVPGITRYAAT
jgi:predicted nucleic acid-binding protein